MENYDKELADALGKYAKIKRACPAIPNTKEDYAWYEEFSNAMYDLLIALGKADVFACVKLEFYDNVAQCAYRKGRPINLTDLIEKRKVAFRPAYLSIHNPDGDEESVMIIGVKPGDIEKYLEKFNMPMDSSPKQLRVPFASLYDLGVKDSNEGDSINFILYAGETEYFKFGADFFELIASQDIDRERFLTYSWDRKNVPSMKIPPLEYFKRADNKA